MVSLTPNATEMLFALGAGDRVVATAAGADHPPEARFLPVIGSYVAPDFEAILAARPDLCVAVRDANRARHVERLQRLGLTVLTLDCGSVASLPGAFRALGRAVGAAGAGDAEARALESRAEGLRAALAGAARRPSVLFLVGLNPMIAVGWGLIDDLITAAGGRNLTAGRTPFPRLDFERALALDPDVLIVTTMTMQRDAPEALKRWDRFPSVSAVRSRRIHTVEAGMFDRPGPRTIEALEVLAALVGGDGEGRR